MCWSHLSSEIPRYNDGISSVNAEYFRKRRSNNFLKLDTVLPSVLETNRSFHFLVLVTLLELFPMLVINALKFQLFTKEGLIK